MEKYGQKKKMLKRLEVEIKRGKREEGVQISDGETHWKEEN